MQLRPIHHGLSTSFVDLPALVRHLRDLQFVGTIRLELSDYEGEIVFTSAGKLHARDHDLAADKSSEGDHAFRNILLKSRDCFGQIHVFHGETELHLSSNLYVDELIRHAALQTVTSRN